MNPTHAPFEPGHPHLDIEPDPCDPNDAGDLCDPASWPDAAALPREMVDAARGWIADVVWADLTAEDVSQLSLAEVVVGVCRHYEGAWPAFVRDSSTTGTEAGR